MTTNLFHLTNVVKTSLNLNRIGALTATLVLLFSLAIGNAWASSSTYYSQLQANGSTGKGYVYASKNSGDTPLYEESSESELTSSGTSQQQDTYYAWAKAVRGSVFTGWSATSGSPTVSGSSNPYTVKVKESNSNGSTNTGIITANWNTYTKVNVTYNPSEDGSYSVTYQYDSYDSSSKNITTGDAEGLSRTITFDDGAQTIPSYHNDIVTLQSVSGEFQGWYSDAGCTTPLTGVTDNGGNPKTYTFEVPESGAVSIYAKYPHVDRYYGRLTVSIAAVPYSMPGGGVIYATKDPGVVGTYSDVIDPISNISYGSTSQTYYLYAQPTDKRYVFRGWYSDAECTTLISENAECAYNFTATSTNLASPTTGNVYAAFDFNLYYMQVEVQPGTASQGCGMVLVSDTEYAQLPEYGAYSYLSSQFAYAYRLAPTATVYLYAKPKYGYTFSGWYDNPECYGDAIGTDNPQTYAATGSSTDPMNPTIVPVYAKFVPITDGDKISITYNIPDQTKGEYTASVLDIEEVDDEYVWTFTEIYNSADYTANTTISQYKTEILRLEATPKTAAYGVTSWTIADDAKSTASQLYETSATVTGKAYGVTFGDAKPFMVSAANATTGTQYSTLSEALSNLGSNKKITVVQNAYVPAGDYEIPNGVTLLVPNDANYTITTNEPTKSSGTAAPTPYSMLTIASGAHINVIGAICVNAIIRDSQNSNTAPTGPCGMITMESGSQIELQSGANMYVWGCVLGTGDITAHSGSKVYEAFQANDYPGGTFLMSNIFTLESKKIFPIRIYCVPNIQAFLHIEYGAEEKLSVSFASMSAEHNIGFIGSSSGMFRLASGTTVTKWYDKANDRQRYSVAGNAELASISMKVQSMYDVNSQDFVLPITHNMQIDFLSGTTTIDYDIELLPGAKVTIASGATVNIKSGASAYVYDVDEWNQGHTFAKGENKSVIYGRTKTMSYKKADLTDAILEVNGQLNVNGALYTTSAGGDIISTGGGRIQVNAIGSATYINQVVQASSNSWDKVNVTPAKLHNGDGSYVLTKDATAGDKFIYDKLTEKWMTNPKTISWNANGGTTEDAITVYSEGSFLGELPVAYKDGYTVAGWYTAASGGIQISQTTKVTADATYYAHWNPKTYTITYMDEGKLPFSGTHVDSPNQHPTTHIYGTPTTLNSATKEGDTFGGWYTVSSCRDGTVITTIDATAITKDITLYAKWINKKLAISASPDEYGSVSHTSLSVPAGTTITSSGNSFTVNGSTTVTATPIPSTEEYVYSFERWHNLPATVTHSASILAVFLRETTVASVTVGGATTYFASIDKAFAFANLQTANMEIKLLNDAAASASLVYTAAYNCTLDLNNHTLSGAIAGKLLEINASGKTFTIDDSSTAKGGRIENSKAGTAHYYAVYLTAGTLNLEHGTIHSSNPSDATYSSLSSNAKKCVATGVYVSASQTFNMNGGTVSASAIYLPYAVETAGKTNLNSGTVTSTATKFSSAYGVWSSSTTKIYEGVTINASSTKSTTAYGVYVAGGTTTLYGGTINSTATSSSGTTVAGIYVYSGTATIPETSTLKVTAKSYGKNCYGVYVNGGKTANIYGGQYTVESTNGTSVYGVYSLGTTKITGGDFTVTAKNEYARGVECRRGTTTISGNPVFTIKAASSAYGATASATTPGKTGGSYQGTLKVQGGTFNVETTDASSGTTAYGVYVCAGTGLSMFSTTSDSVPGNYIKAGIAEVSGGIFNVKAKTNTAYGIYVNSGTQSANADYDPVTAYGKCTVTGGKYNVTTLGDANGTAFAMSTNVNATDWQIINGGWYSTNKTSASTVIEDKYTAPTKDCNYYVLPLTGQDPYQYEVAEVFNVTFNANGHGTAPASQQVVGGKKVIEPTAPTAAEWIFGGWYKEAGCTNAWIFNTDVVNANTILYAKWTQAVASVTAGGSTTYHATIASAISAANEMTNATVTMLQSTSTTEVTIAAAMTIDLNGKTISSTQATTKKAVFKIETASKSTTVTIQDGGSGGKIDHTANVSGYVYGINLTKGTLNVTGGTIYAKNNVGSDNSGYRTYAIYTPSGSSSNCAITISNGTIEAHSPNTQRPLGICAYCNLTMTGSTVIADGYTLVRGIWVQNTTTSLTDVTITATATNGYSYAVVNKAGTMTINSGTYTATGKTDTYAILENDGTVNIISGKFSGSTKEFNKEAGTTSISGGYYVHNTDLAANCAENYHVFDLAGQSPYLYEVAEAYKVTWDAATNGGSCATEYTIVKKSAAIGTLPEASKTGSDFSGWFTAASGGTQITTATKITAAQTYYAQFAPQTYSITYKDQGDVDFTGIHGSGYPTYHTYGTATTLVSPTKTGYSFEGWFDNADCTGDALTEIGAAAYTADFALYAKWTSAETGFWLDIVDVDNNAKTLKLNVSGTEWPASGWPYSIKVGDADAVSYGQKSTSGLPNYRADDRTITVSYAGNPGDEITITVNNASSTTTSMHSYVIPAEIKVATSIESDQSEPLFVKGTVLTINNNLKAKNIYVGPDAKLVINSGKKLTVDTLFLRTTPESAAELVNDGTITGQVYYTRIISDKSGYKPFGLPLSCAIDEVKLSNGNSVGYKTSSGWILRYYDENKRATTGPKDNWVTLSNTGADENKTIQAGKGYEMYSGVNYYREFYFPVNLVELTNSVTVAYTAGDKAVDNGWNLLVSPLTQTFTLTPKPEDMTVNWMQADGSFEQENPSVIPPAKTFAYQATKSGSIVFEGTSMTIPSIAPRRVTAIEESTQIQWIHLDVEDANGVGDQTSIYSHPTRYEETYKTGIDVAKQSFEASRALLYSTHAYGEMAFAGVSDALLEQGVALTLYSPAEQKLTISMRENDWLNRMAYVWLIDKETGARTDLLMNDYRFIAPQGTTTGRFFIQGQFFAPQVATDIQNTQSDDQPGNVARKLLIDQKIYIQVNGKLYDTTGKLVIDK